MSRWLDMNINASDDICEQIDDLVEGYALGSLETDELLLVGETIDQCPEAAARLRLYEETVGLLGLAAAPVEPAPEVWARLDRSTRRTAPAENLTTFPGRKERGVTLPRWLVAVGSIAAMLLLASTISLGVALQRSDDEASDPVSNATVAEYLMAGGEMMQLSSWAAPEWMTWPGRGTVITAPDMPPIVMVDQCAPTGDTDWDYVVWLRVGNERMSMGQMEIGEDGKGIIQLEGVGSLEQYDAIGISIRKSDSTVYDVMEGAPTQSG